jgi:hypothetical protein
MCNLDGSEFVAKGDSCLNSPSQRGCSASFRCTIAFLRPPHGPRFVPGPLQWRKAALQQGQQQHPPVQLRRRELWCLFAKRGSSPPLRRTDLPSAHPSHSRLIRLGTSRLLLEGRLSCRISHEMLGAACRFSLLQCQHAPWPQSPSWVAGSSFRKGRIQSQWRGCSISGG